MKICINKNIISGLLISTSLLVSAYTDIKTLIPIAATNTPTPTEDREAIRFIEQFYTNYMDDNINIDSLKQNCLTVELQDKVTRMINVIGSDPIIRAQDFSEEMKSGLIVKHLKDDWYEVSIPHTTIEDKKEKERITLVVKPNNGKYQISYITPPWCKSAVENTDYSLNEKQEYSISNNNIMEFVMSFYQAYVQQYCNMPTNMKQNLALLRKQYCTEACLKEFDDTKAEYLLDGTDGYDLLIGNFDFDKEWAENYSFTPKGENRILFTYNGAFGDVVKLEIRTIKVRTAFKIDSVNKKN